MPVEIASAVIQTIAGTAPKIFFLTRRCLKGRNVVCVRSKEIATRLIIDAECETLAKTQIRRINSSLRSGLIVQKFENAWPNWKMNEGTDPSKHISKSLVDHQVHAALAKTALFQVNNDCKGIQRHYSNSLNAKHC